MRPQIIESARIFDGEQVHERASLRIVGDRIDRIGPDVQPGPDDIVHRGEGWTVLPGLIDCHVHSDPTTTAHALLFGVTTELDMNSRPAWMDELRAAAATRTDVADIRSSSTGVTMRGGHPTQLVPAEHAAHFPVVDAPDQVEAFVDARIAEGADYLKVYIEDGEMFGRRLPPTGREIVRRAVEVGHDRGMLVVAHALKRASAEIAVESGVDGLVHLFVDEPLTRSLVEAMLARSVFLVPTLTTLGSLTTTRSLAALADDPRVVPYLTPEWAANLRSTWPDNGTGARLDTALASLALAHAGGVEILAGSDAARAGSAPGSAHGVSLHDELRLLVEGGLTPIEALRAATAGAARAFGLADRGTLRPGTRADLVAVDGDPTTSVQQTLAISAVWRGGVALDRHTAVHRLRDAAAEVASGR